MIDHSYFGYFWLLFIMQIRKDPFSIADKRNWNVIFFLFLKSAIVSLYSAHLLSTFLLNQHPNIFFSSFIVFLLVKPKEHLFSFIRLFSVSQ